MKLSEKLGQIYAEEMEKIVVAEQGDPNYLPQEDYDTCEERAAYAVKVAMERPTKFLALAIAHHRVNNHAEDRSEEITTLSAQLSPEDQEAAAESWWVG